MHSLFAISLGSHLNNAVNWETDDDNSRSFRPPLSSPNDSRSNVYGKWRRVVSYFFFFFTRFLLTLQFLVRINYFVSFTDTVEWLDQLSKWISLRRNTLYLCVTISSRNESSVSVYVTLCLNLQTIGFSRAAQDFNFYEFHDPETEFFSTSCARFWIEQIFAFLSASTIEIFVLYKNPVRIWLARDTQPAGSSVVSEWSRVTGKRIPSWATNWLSVYLKNVLRFSTAEPHSDVSGMGRDFSAERTRRRLCSAKKTKNGGRREFNKIILRFSSKVSFESFFRVSYKRLLWDSSYNSIRGIIQKFKLKISSETPGNEDVHKKRQFKK